MRTPVTVGIVGDTDRSTALARAFSESPLSSLRWITDERSRPRWTGGGLRTAWTADFDTLLDDEELDAIVFSSTAVAAQGRAREALEADKHVYIEGPLAFTAAEANELVHVAERRDRCLWAQSTPLLASSTVQLRALVEREMLGEIFYLHATRFVRSEETASDLLWGVGVETVALALDLLGDEPVDVRGHHESYRGLGHHDLVFAELRFATGTAFHMHLSCLEGDTVDRFAVVGSDLTAVLDSGKRRELSVYTAGDATRSFDDLSVAPGSAVALSLPQEDATQAACARFVKSVRSVRHAQHGRQAAIVVAVMEELARPDSRRDPVEWPSPRVADGEHTVVELHGR
jgi:predicted dehydrogenase